MAYIHIDWLSVPDSLLSPARPWDSETKMLVLTAYMRVFFIITFSNICLWIFTISIISYHLSGKFHKTLPFIIRLFRSLRRARFHFQLMNAYVDACLAGKSEDGQTLADLPIFHVLYFSHASLNFSTNLSAAFLASAVSGSNMSYA